MRLRRSVRTRARPRRAAGAGGTHSRARGGEVHGVSGAGPPRRRRARPARPPEARAPRRRRGRQPRRCGHEPRARSSPPGSRGSPPQLPSGAPPPRRSVRRARRRGRG